MIKSNNRPSRRSFVKAAAAYPFIPYFFNNTATAFSPQSPNDLPGLALIGAGRMGHNHMRFAKSMCDVVSVVDVDSNHRDKAIKNLTGGKGKGFSDYRRALELPEVDVVYIATPDHWHAKILIEALLAGKDAYCEKPLTLTVAEGKLIQNIQKKTGRIVQVGTMQRSFRNLFVKAVAMAQQGRLGTIKKITATIGGNGGSPKLPAVDIPKWLDWNQWLGPAPEAEFRMLPPTKSEKENEWRIGRTNAHQDFRWWYDYSGGKMTDWGAHHVDIACWVLRAAGQSDALVSIGGKANLPVAYKDGNPIVNDQFNTANKFSMVAKMQGGVEILINSEGRNGVLIEGTKGRIFVNRGTLAGAPVDQLRQNPLPESAIQKVYRGLPLPFNQHKNHWANFFHCTRERIEPISDVTSHLRAINICHLANISARLQRTLQWDDNAQQITGDEMANAMLSRPYRKGFEIEM